VFALGFLLGSQNNTTLISFTLRSNSNNIEAEPNDHRRQLSFMDPNTVENRVPQFLDVVYDQPPPPPTTLGMTQDVNNVRDVHVKSMCRCGSKAMPIPGRPSPIGLDTGIFQPPSKATGMQHAKHFVLHPSDEGQGCTCIENSEFAEATTDMFLSGLKRKCPNPKYPGNYDWNEMPDLGVEESLPIFVGTLSYKSPLTLNVTLHNWLGHDLFRKINAQGVFVQLNKRSEEDDAILQEFQETLLRNEQPPVNVMGSPEENLNPGLAISKFCRAAEAHPSSHPNGENLLMFLEKDWNIYHGSHESTHIEEIFHSINGLVQRGVPYIRLKMPSKESDQSKMWKCPSQGVPWVCTTAHQHRWSNTPMVVSCKWFLRYMEPYALLEDPIMSGCRPGFQENHYCDWEEALQDGRVAWTNSQWVTAHLGPGKRGIRSRLFFHNEVDQ